MSCSKSSDDNSTFAFMPLLNSYTGSTASVTHQQEIIHSETELQDIAKKCGIEHKIAKLPKINFNTEQLVLIFWRYQRFHTIADRGNFGYRIR